MSSVGHRGSGGVNTERRGPETGIVSSSTVMGECRERGNHRVPLQVMTYTLKTTLRDLFFFVVLSLYHFVISGYISVIKSPQGIYTYKVSY